MYIGDFVNNKLIYNNNIIVIFKTLSNKIFLKKWDLVEYIFNEYEEIELFFKVDDDKIILVGLKEYAEFRP